MVEGYWWNYLLTWYGVTHEGLGSNLSRVFFLILKSMDNLRIHMVGGGFPRQWMTSTRSVG